MPCGIAASVCPRNGRWRDEVRHRPPLLPIPTPARKLVEIANAAEAVQDNRIYIERALNSNPMIAAQAAGIPAH
jgi:hypothetical protein